MRTLLLILLTLAFSEANAAEHTDAERLAIAREDARCSWVARFSDSTNTTAEQKEEITTLHVALYRLAEKLAPSPQLVEEWVSEFAKDFRRSIGTDVGKEIGDAQFMRREKKKYEGFFQ
jgi:hypothetical protein